MSDTMLVFDRARVRRNRDRAAPGFHDHDFLFAEVAERLADRLADVKRAFPRALDLGCRGGHMARHVAARPGAEFVAQADLSPAMARRARDESGLPAFAADEETLPIAPHSLDLATSCLSLHWVNDLPGALIQIRQALKPDGFFLAAMLGGDTLFELRRSLQEAEIAVHGGLSPRVSPFADSRDAGGLLQRAGFALPVVDSDVIEVSYPNPFRLMADLRGMGETNAVRERRRGAPRRELFLDAARRYAENFAEADGRVIATFQVVYLAGWAPHESQQKPLKPGSAAARLADALGSVERPAGDKAAPGRR